MTKTCSGVPLPGAHLIEQGVRDLDRHVESIEAMLVSMGASRLRGLGLSVEHPIPAAERRLYEVLQAKYGDAAHSRFNALVRRLVSFERAAASAVRHA